MTTIGNFEAKIRRCERLTVAIIEKSGRDKRGDATVHADYPFERAAPEDWTLAELERNRLAPSLPGYNFRFFDAAGRELHGKTLLRNARLARRP
jgi:hypothetical protein